MGKGGYTGGSTIIRVSPEWFTDGKPIPSQTRQRKTKKAKPAPPPGLLTQEQARAAGLTKVEWLKRCKLRLHTIDEDIAAAQLRLVQLEAERDIARAALEEASRA